LPKVVTIYIVYSGISPGVTMAKNDLHSIEHGDRERDLYLAQKGN
jgi:hypothetical protein